MVKKRERSNYIIQSVAHALDVIEELSDAKQEMGVTDLAKKLGLHKNNIFRLLATLSIRGYVEQNPVSEAYTLGSGCLKVGQAYLLQSDLISRVRPILMGLSEQTGETISFAKLINGDVHFPISIASKKPVSVAARIGETVPAKTCAVGRLLLSQLPDEELSNYIEGNSPQDVAVKNQLAELRTTGTISDRGASEADVLCIAKVVRGLNNTVLGAVEVIAPLYRAKANDLMPALEQVTTVINDYYASEGSGSLKDQLEKKVSGGEMDIGAVGSSGSMPS